MDEYSYPTHSEKTRVIELDNNKVYLKQKDPYGYWYVNFDKGQMPENLKGAYTDYDYAYKSVVNYLNANNRKIVKQP